MQQVGFDHIFQRLRLFLQGRGDGFHAHRPSEVLVHHHFQIAPIEGGEAELVNSLQAQRGVCEVGEILPPPFTSA